MYGMLPEELAQCSCRLLERHKSVAMFPVARVAPDDPSANSESGYHRFALKNVLATNNVVGCTAGASRHCLPSLGTVWKCAETKKRNTIVRHLLLKLTTKW